MPHGVYQSVWKPGGAETLLVWCGWCYQFSSGGFSEDLLGVRFCASKRTHIQWPEGTCNQAKKALYPRWSHLIWSHQITIPSSSVSEIKRPVHTEPQPWLQTLLLFAMLDTFFLVLTKAQRIVFQRRNDVSGIRHLRRIWKTESLIQRQERSTCLWEGGCTRSVYLGAWDRPEFSFLSWHSY